MGKKVLLLGFVLFIAWAFLQGCVIAPARQYGVYTPVAEEEYEEIAYEQAYYVDPPFIVAYPYSHWMYVRNGNFVDVVFVDSFGHRHVEHWNHGGRMTYDRAAGWHRENHRRVAAEKRHKGREPSQVKKPVQEKPVQVQTPKPQPKPQPAARTVPKKAEKKNKKDDKD